jgi:hypothetical protein
MHEYKDTCSSTDGTPYTVATRHKSTGECQRRPTQRNGEQLDEVSQVVDANAVVEEWAVVILPQHAPPTRAAVVHAFRLDLIADGAVVFGCYFLLFLDLIPWQQSTIVRTKALNC